MNFKEFWLSENVRILFYENVRKMALLQTKSSLKRKHSDSEKLCLLCDEPCTEDKSKFPSDSWSHMKDKAFLWKGLDTFGDIYDKVDWNKGTIGIYFHKVCHLKLKSERKLEQAKKCFSKKNEEASSTLRDLQPTNDENIGNVADKSIRLTRSYGVIHDKKLCVWCMKPENKKHTNGQFHAKSPNRLNHESLFLLHILSQGYNPWV